MQRDRAFQQRIVGECRMHRLQIGVEIEHPSHPAHDVRDRAWIGAVDVELQFRSRRDRAHPDPRRGVHCVDAAGADDALVTVRVHAFDARDRTLGQERQQQREIQRRAIAQTQRQRAAGRERRRLLPADRARRHAAAVLERGVEATQAVVAGGERDIRHRQRGFGQQLFRQQQPARGVHGVRGCACMREEHALQLSRAQAHARGQCGDRAVLKRALGDQRQRAPHRVFAHLRMGFGREFRATAQAGAIAGRRGRCRVRIEADVVTFGRRRRADRAAVDAGAAHGDEEQAVETMVLRGHRAEADFAGRKRFAVR